MNREIKIFQSFEEQEKYHLEMMRNTTVFERFKTLFQMQKTTRIFHPVTDKIRKIIIHKNGHTQQ